ncbi:MAG: hypothetical protein AAGC60_06175 [Acidobacteriota bacterium]
MSRRDTILELVMSDRLRAMGEEPPFERLLDLREGHLAEAEREQLLERAAVDPAFARRLLDVLDFPETSSDHAWDEATRTRKWARFVERMQADGDWTESEAATAAEAKRPHAVSGVRKVGEAEAGEAMVHRARRRSAPRWLALAASLLVGVLLGVTLGRLVDGPSSAPPLRNVELIALRYDGQPGERGASIELDAAAEWVQLVLSSATLPDAASYSLQVVDADGREIHRQTGLIPVTGGRLTALVAADRLAPGGYRAQIFVGDGSALPVATARWTVTRTSS